MSRTVVFWSSVPRLVSDISGTNLQCARTGYFVISATYPFVALSNNLIMLLRNCSQTRLLSMDLETDGPLKHQSEIILLSE